MPEDFGFDEPFNEYNDLDSTSCALGDYNAWEENQVFLDHEGYEDRYHINELDDDYEYPEPDPEPFDYGEDIRNDY